MDDLNRQAVEVNKTISNAILAMLLMCLVACGGRGNQNNPEITLQKPFYPISDILPTPTAAPDYIKLIMNSGNVTTLTTTPSTYTYALHQAHREEEVSIFRISPTSSVFLQSPHGSISMDGQGHRSMLALSKPDVLNQVLNRSKEDPRLLNLYYLLNNTQTHIIYPEDALHPAQSRKFREGKYYGTTKIIPVDDDRPNYELTIYDPKDEPIFVLLYRPKSNSTDQNWIDPDIINIDIFKP